jgi:hypothetical protein
VILTIIFFAILLLLLRRQSRERAVLVVIALAAYLAVISGEQIYLENAFNRSFHVSDPSNYYIEVHNKSFDQLLTFLSDGEYRSNTFYYLVNWIFLNNFINTSVTVLIIKLTNVFAFLSAYLLLVGNTSRVNYIDKLILFHPFVFLMLIRNVRDAYILFFLAVFIVAYQTSKPLWQRYSGMSATFLMMTTIRPFFSFLMLCIPLANKLISIGRVAQITVLFSVASVFVVMVSGDVWGVQSKLLSAFMSVVSFHEGYDEEREAALREVMQGDASGLGFLSNYVGMVFKGFIVFLFTPHPINYAVKWFSEETKGMWVIYTTFDNLLIILGAVVNYVIVFPLVIKFLHKMRSVNISIAVTSLFMLVTYSIFQLGITDPRIKYSFIFFVLLGIKLGGLDKIELKKEFKYFLGAAILFLGIGFVGRG